MTFAEKYIDFYTDFGFKRLFGSDARKDLLISFLNALLDEDSPIEDIQYLNTEHMGRTKEDRKAYFDVSCKTENGDQFIVEMQRSRQDYFKDRSVYYSSFAIQEQAPQGKWDYQLKKVYTICFLDFTFEDTEPKEYLHKVQLCNVVNHKVFYDKLYYYYLEMPKFTKTEVELESLMDKWLYAIKNIAKLDTRPDSLQEKIFQRFFEAAEIAKFTRNEQHLYVESRKDRWDYENTMQYKYKEGKIEGKTEGKIEDAKGFKEHGVDIAVISAVTGLSIEEIEKL